MINNENINKSYIIGLSSLPADKVRPVSMQLFINALGQTYPIEKVKKAIFTILDQDDRSFAGVKEFKQRIENAIDGKMAISGADQVYIAGYIHSL